MKVAAGWTFAWKTSWAPLVIFLMVWLGGLLIIRPGLDFKTVSGERTSSLLLVGDLVAALIAAYVIKQIINPVDGGSKSDEVTKSGANSATEPLRDRLAFNVVAVATIGILATAAVLLWALRSSPADEKNTGYAIFTAVLPVFSTWVGTVLAFYFSNASFVAASQAAQGLANAQNASPLTRPGTMVPYEKIIRRELTDTEVGTADPQAVADALPVSEVKKLFNPPGVVRVVVFDNKKNPIYVINHNNGIISEADATLIGVFMKKDDNLAQAKNFARAAKSATIDDGRRMIELRKVTDLFVTEFGKEGEPCIGWVPDDNLK